jgi:hypothetical protein
VDRDLAGDLLGGVEHERNTVGGVVGVRRRNGVTLAGGDECLGDDPVAVVAAGGPRRRLLDAEEGGGVIRAGPALDLSDVVANCLWLRLRLLLGGVGDAQRPDEHPGRQSEHESLLHDSS